MSERCQTAYGRSDDIVCYGIVGAVEKCNSRMWALSACARNSSQDNYTKRPKSWYVAMSGPFHDGEQIV